MNEEEIFHQALARRPEERAAYLEQACAGHPALRSEVEALLRANVGATGFLEQPAPALAATVEEQPFREESGTILGPYKLLEQIGEGGFGVVFMAEQQQPIRRKVALKVLKPGMDTRQVVARFEAERQALALMDHPHIAHVFDGGETASGRPYFVMELVRGIPITDFCDQNRLSILQRLELFVGVCHAVQHAHQKGIIHRDIKPSNVMVTLHDGTPVVKVIDFGIAKATGQQLTDKTLFTHFSQMIGTPLYMSPEQAGMSGLDVDTRSDIYSLGVVLYELLTGTTPFDKERLKEMGYDEMRRIIREEEPPRPSTRLSTIGRSATIISAQRRSEPKRLSQLFRGELDWIVMKALEKDRNRRYETASAFAADVQRYLHDEPVLACPPSAWYRFRKFARRNRGRLSAAALLGLVLMVTIVAIRWEAQKYAVAEQDRSERQKRLTDRVDVVIAEVELLEREQKWPEALATAQRAEAALASGEADAETQQRVRDVLYDLAFVTRLDRIRQEGDTLRITKGLTSGNQQIVAHYARAFRDYGVDVEQLPVATAVARLSARPALALPIIDALYDWVMARHFPFGARDAGEQHLLAIARGLDADSLRYQLWQWLAQPVTPALQAQLRQLAQSVDVRSQHPETLRLLARNLRRASLPDAALQILRDSQQTYPGHVWLNSDLASFLSQKQDSEALRYLAAAVAARPDSAAAHHALGLYLFKHGKPQEAAACFRKVTEIAPTLWIGHYYLGVVLRDMLNQPAGAVVCMSKVLELDPKHGVGYLGLGMALADQNKLDEAIACYHKAIAFGSSWPSIGMRERLPSSPWLNTNAVRAKQRRLR
jgi:serine/threonine protein kinase